MKKNILIALCCCSLLAFTACSDDYNDATSKHVYGENENPYMKINASAQVGTSVGLEVNGEHSYTLSLGGYASKFDEQMGMSLDAVISGLDTKGTVFYPINTTRNQWAKTAYTTDGIGWAFNSAGQPCKVDDADSKATVTLDKNTKTLKVSLTEGGIKAGTTLTINVGFAVNGPDYDKYVRFTFNIGVTDPTVAVISQNIGSDELSIPIVDYEENIANVFDMTVEDFISTTTAAKQIKFCLADSQTGEWLDMGEKYTANNGYWMNASGASTSWGTTGYAVYAEYRTDEGVIALGRNTDIAKGTTGKLSVGFVDVNDHTKCLRFIVSYTME